MMTMTWIVSINMVIAQFELHNKKHLELVFFTAVGYIAFLTPSNQLLLKGRMSGLLFTAMRYYWSLFPLRWQRSVPCHQYSWASFTKCSCCCLAGHCCFFPLTDEYVFFSAYVYFYRIKRVVLESENASA